MRGFTRDEALEIIDRCVSRKLIKPLAGKVLKLRINAENSDSEFPGELMTHDAIARSLKFTSVTSGKYIGRIKMNALSKLKRVEPEFFDWYRSLEVHKVHGPYREARI